MTERDSFHVNWVNALGAALGAVSGAVLLSGLGAAGTVVGAALSSVCITVGGAFYSHSMRVTQQRLAATQQRLVAAQQVAAQQSRTQQAAAPGRPRRRPKTPVGIRQPALDARTPTQGPGGRHARQPWGPHLIDLPWRRIGLTATGLFVLAMALIVAFELSTGRPVSSWTGGTSDSRTGTSIPGIGERDTVPVTQTPATPTPNELQSTPTSRKDPVPTQAQPTPTPDDAVGSPPAPGPPGSTMLPQPAP